MTLPSGTRLGPYEVVSLLGAGGMGEVYRARDARLGREVAVKVGAKTKGKPSCFAELVASGVIRPPLEAGDPTEEWPDMRLPAGTAAELMDADRGEA